MTNIITHTEIKKMLVTYYGTNIEDNMQQELVVHRTNVTGGDAVMYLSGSPPKGYCISVGGLVSLYDLWGKRFKMFHSTRLEIGDDDE